MGKPRIRTIDVRLIEIGNGSTGFRSGMISEQTRTATTVFRQVCLLFCVELFQETAVNCVCYMASFSGRIVSTLCNHVDDRFFCHDQRRMASWSCCHKKIDVVLHSKNTRLDMPLMIPSRRSESTPQLNFTPKTPTTCACSSICDSLTDITHTTTSQNGNGAILLLGEPGPLPPPAS